MEEMFILVEGIDGSGKDTFVDILREELMKRFYYDELATISIVGQPAFKFDKDNHIRKLIEYGQVECSCQELVKKLTENRQRHEHDISIYKGITICIRGLLTDLATLERVYGVKEKTLLGQEKFIDKLIIIDVDPQIAWERIQKRDKIDWRETPENLKFFRNFYINYVPKKIVAERIVIKNNDDIKKLKSAACTLAETLLSETIKIQCSQ